MDYKSNSYKIVRKCCNAKLYKNEKCICKQVTLIQHYVKIWYSIISSLDKVKYNKSVINFSDINFFSSKERSKNDSNNKKRENIIGGVINNQIPVEYYKYSLRWRRFKESIDKYIDALCLANGVTDIKCVCNDGVTLHTT